MNKAQHTTRNIRKPGCVGKFKFYSFIQNCNGLIVGASKFRPPHIATVVHNYGLKNNEK